MIIDKKGKLFGKVSIIDLLIVVVVIAAILGVLYKFNQSSTVTPFSDKDKIEVKLQTDDVEKFAIDAIEIGDTVKDWNSGVVLGKLVDFKVGESKLEYYDDQGQVVLSSRDDHVSVELFVEGEGIYSESGTTSFGSNSYFINRSMEIAVGDVILWIRISEINLAE